MLAIFGLFSTLCALFYKIASKIQVQYNLIITLSLGSIDADRVISETML